jgi:hypothetical protein
MAEYICIAAGEKFQPARANAQAILGIAAAFLQHYSRDSAALQPRSETRQEGSQCLLANARQ